MASRLSAKHSMLCGAANGAGRTNPTKPSPRKAGFYFRPIPTHTKAPLRVNRKSRLEVSLQDGFAEGAGFEPADSWPSPTYQAGAINHSTNPGKCRARRFPGQAYTYDMAGTKWFNSEIKTLHSLHALRGAKLCNQMHGAGAAVLALFRIAARTKHCDHGCFYTTHAVVKTPTAANIFAEPARALGTPARLRWRFSLTRRSGLLAQAKQGG